MKEISDMTGSEPIKHYLYKTRVFLSNDFFGKEKIEFSEKTITQESTIDGKVYHLTFNYQAAYLGNNSFEITYSENNPGICFRNIWIRFHPT